MDLLCKAFKGLGDLPFDFMKTILLYILGSILITDVIARERFNLDFKPDVEDFLEKEKLLSLPGLKRALSRWCIEMRCCLRSEWVFMQTNKC